MSSLPCGDGETVSPTPRPYQPTPSPHTILSPSHSPLRPLTLPDVQHSPASIGRSLSSPVRTRSPGASPARKRLKLDLSGLSPVSRQKRLCEHRMTKLRHVTTSCREDLTELYFITSGSNLIDLPMFRKKPNQAFINFLTAQQAPARVISEVQTAVLGSALLPLEVRRHAYSPRVGALSPVKVGYDQEVYSPRFSSSPPCPTLPPPSAPVYSMDQIQEKIKQEGWVLSRVSELNRDGMWPLKRLPKVVEQPRPVAAWDLVLEEMKWLAADFQQERIWKKSAARVQAAAVREFVTEKREVQAQEEEELRTGLAQRKIARSISDQIKQFWGHVSSLYEYELVRRRTIFNTNLISTQLNHVSEYQTNGELDELLSSRKRKIEDLSSGRSSPNSEFSPSENGGVWSDDESTIAEQEAYELLNCVSDNELKELETDASTELSILLRANYPGVMTDYSTSEQEYLEEYFEDSDSEPDSELDSLESHVHLSIDCLLKDRTEKTNGDLNKKDLIEISETAENLLPKSVITSNGSVATPTILSGRLYEYQLVALGWLQAMYREKLPTILSDDQGLGRRVVTAAFISYLVCELGSPGPHLIIAPVSSLKRWGRVLSTWCPGLRVSVFSGNLGDRRTLRNQLYEDKPHIVLTSYRAYCRFSHWFNLKKWGLLVLSEVQNIVVAGSPDQILSISQLRSDRRMLIMSGAHKENPYDLWNTLYMLFPSTYNLHSESCALVEGTAEYTDAVKSLQKVLCSFTLSRSRSKHPLIEKQLSPPNDVPTFVNMSSKQRKLYDDYLASPSTKDLLHTGDLSSVCTVIQQLRNICNHPNLVTSPTSSPALPTWSRLNPRPASRIQKLVESSPLDSVSFENMNLVFLKQELTTTVLTSARLRSIKASRELIQELPEQSSSKYIPPRVPAHKISFSLEGITRTVNGWNIPGGWVDGMGLVRAATGQVFKVCSNPLERKDTGSSPSPDVSGGLYPDSISSIGEINHWRCSGFPLYGQDLIRSLEITNSARPARSRFSGQGFINCLLALTGAPRLEKDDWRFTTNTLQPLVKVGAHRIEQLLRTLNWTEHSELDPRTHSSKLQALDRILEERIQKKEKVLLFTSTQDILHTLHTYSNFRNIRYVSVSDEMDFSEKVSAIERFSLEPRYTLLILCGLTSFIGLNLPQVGTVIEYDWSPLHTDLSTRILGWNPQTVFRLMCRGTVEESLGRRTLLRCVLADLETLNQNTLKKQTIEHLLYPQTSDNGFFWNEKKKKDKTRNEIDEKLEISHVFSLLGAPGGDQPSCILDLAEIDTFEEDDYVEEDGFKDIQLMDWIESVSPLHRYGVKQITDSPSLKSLDQWIREEPENKEEAKLSLEVDICRRAEKRRREEETFEYVSYPNHLSNRDWKDETGELTLWKPPGYFEEMEDYCTGLLYSTEPIQEENLPPVYIKKEKKHDSSVGQINSVVSSPVSGLPLSPADNKPKIRRDDNVTAAPKSLFDRPKPFKTIARPRPPGALNPVSFPSTTLTTQIQNQTIKTVPREGESGPDWLIQEDWALHQAVISLQEMPLSLSANSPAHISNWDMVSDMVNAVSKCYRSPRQCRTRYETTVLPREEGKILYNDITPTKKQKKTGKLIKGIEKKPSISKPMKTSVLFKQDNNSAWSTQFSSRFQTIKAIANKRTPTTKPLLVNSTQRNPKHASVLAEFGVDYDNPLNPVSVAANRADRILRDKQRNQQAAAAQAQLAVQQPNITAVPQQPQQQQQQQQQQMGLPVRVSVANVSASMSVASSGNMSSPAQAVVVGISQPVQQHIQQGQIVSVSQMSNSGRVGGNQTVVTVSGVLSGLQTTSTLTRLAGGQIVVSQTGKSVAVGSQSGTLQVAGRSLTPAQIQVLKTQAMKRQEQQLRARQLLQNSVTVSSGSAASVVSALSTARTIAATAGIGRGQIVRPTNVRSMTEPELKAMLAKQQLKVTGPGLVQVQPGASLSTAQLQQLGIQVATASPGTSALVKAGGVQQGKSVTIPITGVNLQGGQLKQVAGRGTVINQNVPQIQQLRQLMMRKHGVQQKVALQQVGGKLPAQLIVQGQQGKGLPATVTVQQLQQIVKSVAGSGQGQVQIGTVAGTGQQIISHAVLTKPGLSGGQTVQARVIPVSGTAGRGQQTIQVVTASPGGIRGTVPNVTLDALSRQQGGAASAIASALAAGNHVKIAAPGGATQQQILSQVTAALAGQTGQPVSVAVRTPGNVSTITQQGQIIQQQQGQLTSQGQLSQVNQITQGQMSQQGHISQGQIVQQNHGSHVRVSTSNPHLVNLQLNVQPSVSSAGNSNQTNQNPESG